jgi:hypothetical protein
MFNIETELLVAIFQEIFRPQGKHGDSDVDRNPVNYVQRHKRQIEMAGQLFEYLRLAKPDTQSPLGWRPTRRLVKIIAKRAVRRSMPLRRTVDPEDDLIRELMFDTVFGDLQDDSVTVLGVSLLFRLGLMRNDINGESLPSLELRELFAEGYYARLELLAKRESEDKLALQALTNGAARQSPR